MGVSERKEREKADMKELIRAAALKMFLQEGYAKTSIRNIAEEIEYSPGTIYLYYKDKDELLYEVQRHAYGKLLEAFKANANSEDPITRLRQIGETYITFGIENPELYDLMFIIRAPMNVDENVHKNNGRAAFEFLINQVTTCVEQDLLRVTDPQEGSLQLWAMAHGLVSLNLRCRLKDVGSEESLPQILNSSMENFVNILIK